MWSESGSESIGTIIGMKILNDGNTKRIIFNCSKDQSLTSMSEFTVQKITHRHPDPTKRILCLTDATILERDPQTYSVS